MSDTANPCPTSDQLKALLDGSLEDAMLAVTQSHVDGCEACQQVLEKLTTGSQSWDDVARQLRGNETPKEQGMFTDEPLLQDVMARMKDSDAEAATPGNGTLPSTLLSPSNHPGAIGRIGRYEVLEVVGQGGMGIVLRAFDPTLHRVVAVKVLAPYLAHNAQARKRFVREAQAVAAVCHDHVITIHSIEDSTEQPLIVMQFVHGRSLQQKIDQSGSLSVKEVLRIAMQTAAGLAAAHQQGLVHRDVKPSNILLENGIERVKLTDFGLARAVDDASLTQSGVIAGTPQYMAPEQANGDAVDHRADLFSLGSVMYAMCTGHSPFRASTTMGVLKRVCHDTPRQVRDINPDIPQWLDDIIGTLLEKDPKRRFQTAKEVSEVLAAWLAHLQTPANVPPPAIDPPSGTKSNSTSTGSTRRAGSIPRSTHSVGNASAETATFADPADRRPVQLVLPETTTVLFQEVPGRLALFFLLAGFLGSLIACRLNRTVNMGEAIAVSALMGIIICFWGLLLYAFYRLVLINIRRAMGTASPFVATSTSSASGPRNGDGPTWLPKEIAWLLTTRRLLAIFSVATVLVLVLPAQALEGILAIFVGLTTIYLMVKFFAAVNRAETTGKSPLLIDEQKAAKFFRTAYENIARFYKECFPGGVNVGNGRPASADAPTQMMDTGSVQRVVGPEDSTHPTSRPAVAAALTPAEMNALLARQRTVTLSFVLFFIAIGDFLCGAYFLFNYDHAMRDLPDLFAIMIGCFSLITGFHTFLLSHSLYMKENFDLVRRGCLIGMLPLSPMVIVRFPVLLTMIFWLEREEVKSSFSTKAFPETVLGQVDASLGGVLSRFAPMRVLGSIIWIFAWVGFVLIGLLLPFMYFYLIPAGPAEYFLHDATAFDVRTRDDAQATLNIVVNGNGEVSGIVSRPEIPRLTQVRIESFAPDGTGTTFLMSTDSRPLVTVLSRGESHDLDREICRRMLRIANDSKPESITAAESLHKALVSLVLDARAAETNNSTSTPVPEDLWSQFTRRITAFSDFMDGNHGRSDELKFSRYTPLAERLDLKLFSHSNRGHSHFSYRFTEIAMAGTIIGTLAVIAVGALFILYRRHLKPVRLKPVLDERAAHN